MKRKQVWCATLVLVITAAAALSAGAIPATVLTNTGYQDRGDLTGLGQILRLVRPTDPPLVGPDVQYDVPLSSIRQITFDFPRVIIETATRTLVGPFATFLGIDENVIFRPTNGDSDSIPVAALRAIALNGNDLRKVPREWLGTQFLSEPDVVPGSNVQPLAATDGAACDDCTIDTTSFEPVSPADETPIWNTITPTLQPEEPAAELPWWLGLLGVAALVGVFYVLSTQSS